ncbi:MAG: hypothetical protein HYZ81_13540 [Nitrospinae bacterium]|nr:hypothetical protein [Nitrospinota bacterium]
MNRDKAFKIIKWLLISWGALSLIGAISVGGFVAYRIGPGNRDRVDSASSSDVAFVLNWCNLGADRIEKVVHSYVSARSFTGDHLDAYAIKIKHIDVAELTASTDDFRGRWYRGDQLPKVLDDAVGFVGSWPGSAKIQWFPTEKALRSREFYVYPCSIYLHGITPSATELIFVRPSDKMVFYFGGKM